MQLYTNLTGAKPSGTQTMQMQGPLGEVPFEQAQGLWRDLSSIVQIQGPRIDFIFQPPPANSPSKIPLISEVPRTLDDTKLGLTTILPTILELNRIGLVTIFSKIASSLKDANRLIVEALELGSTAYASAIDLIFRANLRNNLGKHIINHTYTWQTEAFQNVAIAHTFNPSASPVSEPTFSASTFLDFNNAQVDGSLISEDANDILELLIRETKEYWKASKPIGEQR